MTTLVERILQVAAEDLRTDIDDEFNPADWSGGNFDDAFDMGVDEGAIVYARRLVAEFGLDK